MFFGVWIELAEEIGMFILFPGLNWKVALPSTPLMDIIQKFLWRQNHFPFSGKASIQIDKLSLE